MTLSNNSMTGSITLHESEAAHNYMALPAGFSDASEIVIDASAGKIVAIEWVLDAMPQVEGYTAAITINNAALDVTYVAPALLYGSDDYWHLNLGSLTLVLTGPASRIGLYFDGDTGEIGALLDGEDQGVIDTYTPGDIAIGLSTYVDATLVDGQEGEIVTHSLVVEAFNMTGTAYPEFTTDMGGHLVNFPPL